MLTTKQKAFVEAYHGNGADAARAAGYRGTPHALAVSASRLLEKPEVKAAIEARERPRQESRIATREERQRFWTLVMLSDGAEMKDRLKASELLGRSQVDFTDKLQVDAKVTLEQLVLQASKASAP